MEYKGDLFNEGEKLGTLLLLSWYWVFVWGWGSLFVRFFGVVVFFGFLFACLFVGVFACLCVCVCVFAVCQLTYLCAKPFHIRVRSRDNKQKTRMNHK